MNASEGQTASGSDMSEQSTTVLPVIEERLEVEKRQVQSGGVRVSKHVHEREVSIDRPGFTEEVEVERVPVNRVIQAPASVRYEGDTVVVPVMEEVVVVERRLVLREELRITKRRREIHEPQRVTVRREEAIVEPLEANREQGDRPAA